MTAYLYPALVVVWGLWKAHSVIGWSVIGIHGVNTAVFITVAVLLDESLQGPSIEGSAWTEYLVPYIAMMPIAVTGLHLLLNFWWLVIFMFFWRWDRRLPPPVKTPQDNGMMPDQWLLSGSPRKQWYVLLLASAVVCVVLGGWLTLWFSLTFMGSHETALFHLVMGAHWLTWPNSVLETLHPVFHMVSVTVLGFLLMLGLVYRRSDVAETACWLLLPGQLLTVSLLPVPLLAVVSTLAMVILGLLVQWYHGFPMALLQTRRGEQISSIVGT